MAAVIVPKKIWTLAPGYSSNVLCLCMSVKEARGMLLRTLTQKTEAVEHTPHSVLVGLVQTQNATSEGVQKFLLKKYQAIWRQARVCTTVEALKGAWAEASEALEGWYWALVHHPLADNSLIEEVTLDLWLRLARSRRQLVLLAQQYQEALHTQKQLKARLLALQETQTEKKTVHLGRLDELGLLQKQLMDAVHEKQAYQQQVYKLQKEIEFLKAKQQDLSSSSQKSGMGLPVTAAVDCAVVQEEACEALEKDTLNLQGKAVLFIGGLRSQVPHFREWIERVQGKFLYHDGGLEHHYTHLNTLVSQADWVVCPLDCVSHNALQTAKKLCQRQDKPCVLLKKSSFSMFSHSVHVLLKDPQRATVSALQGVF